MCGCGLVIWGGGEAVEEGEKQVFEQVYRVRTARNAQHAQTTQSRQEDTRTTSSRHPRQEGIHVADKHLHLYRACALAWMQSTQRLQNTNKLLNAFIVIRGQSRTGGGEHTKTHNKPAHLQQPFNRASS